jgi:predicted short-subunit dehydrogenase-like oxidoreductase (DUF2520 family)
MLGKLGRMAEIRKGVAVIGAGNWGSSLAAGVVAAGIPLVEVVARSSRGRRPKSGGVAAVSWENAKLDADVLWLCVPDGEISGVAERIAGRRVNLRGQLVVHSSGALTIAALEAVRLAGAGVGGIAPVFSFPTRKPLDLRDVMFVVEPGPGQAGKLTALVRKLGGKPVRISSESKVLYHAAATMASPLLVSALQAAVSTAGLAGLNPREAEAVVRVLAETSLRNFFSHGAGQSFSGVFARGDAGTVELHLGALLKHRILYCTYLALARNAVESLPVRNGLELERVLDSALDSVERERRVRN